jgi:hypothetical protein
LSRLAVLCVVLLQFLEDMVDWPRHSAGSGLGWCTTPRTVSNLTIRNRNLMELEIDPSILSLDFNSRTAGASGQSRRYIPVQESQRRCR